MALIGEKVMMFGDECYIDASGNVVTLEGTLVKHGVAVDGCDVRNITDIIVNRLVNESEINSELNNIETIKESILDALSDILL